MSKLSQGISRRRALATLAAGSAFAAGGIYRPAIAQAREEFTLIIGSSLGMEWVPEMNARAGGHFEKQGLDVQLVNVRGTAVAIQQVLAGRAKFGSAGSIDLIKAFAKKQPIMAIATISQGSIYTVASLKSAPIMKPEDLRGKVFGVVSLGGSTENMLDLLLASAGMKKEDVQRQPIGRSMGALELVKQQRVHAFLSIPEIDVAIRRNNEPFEIWNTDKYAPLPGQSYLTTQEFAASNGATIQKYVRAMRASVEDILTADPNVILDRIEKAFEVAGPKERGYRIEAMKAYNELIVAQGRQNILRNVPQAWKTGVDLMAKAGLADVRSEIDTLYTNKFVEAAMR